MLNKEGRRELAYFVEVGAITPMNADRLECAHVGGWNCVVGKEEFRVGELAVYFEIDSLLPDRSPFSSMDFLRSKHFKIKTQKIRGVYSQGLLMPLSAFGWEEYTNEDGSRYVKDNSTGELMKDNEFLTDRLGITYAVFEDNARKAGVNDKYQKMTQRHPKLSKTRFWKKLYKTTTGRKILFACFGKKRDKKGAWPSHIAAKTDQERLANMVWVLQDKNPWVATEKIDGSSCSIMIEKLKFGRLRQYVCSRNVVFDSPDSNCFYSNNIYYEMYEKYGFKEKMPLILKEVGAKTLAIQMEIYGSGVQKRTYSTDSHKIAVFHIVIDGVKIPMEDVVKICEKYDLPHVPILNSNYILPDTIEEVQEYVESDKSWIDGLPREGIVFYDKTNSSRSFKFVSPSYLIKYH